MSSETYQDTRSRLEEILEEVNKEDISLDDALELYEEAVKLSLAACDLSESDLDLNADPSESGEMAGGGADVSASDIPVEDGAVENNGAPSEAAGDVSESSF